MAGRPILPAVLMPALLAVGLTTSTAYAAGEHLWTRQYGSGALDDAVGVDTDRSGNVYVAGRTFGVLPGKSSQGAVDVYLRRYSSAGKHIWTRQFGTDGSEYASAVAVDGSGDIYVAGITWGAMTGKPPIGAPDGFLRKYSPAGKRVWTRQFGTADWDAASALAIDGSGNVYVAGTTLGTFPGQPSPGNGDIYVRKYSPAGGHVWTREFGTTAEDLAVGVDTDGAGNLYVAGTTQGALTGEPPAGSTDVFLRKYSGSGQKRWTRQFGTADAEILGSIAVDRSGDAYLAGSTQGALTAKPEVGNGDAFLRRYSSRGKMRWTRQFGTTAWDTATGVAMDGSGNVYVAGDTLGAFTDEPPAGATDIFLRKYTGGGQKRWTRQFGSDSPDSSADVAIHGSRSAHVVGSTQGALTDKPSAGLADAFVRKYKAS